MKQLLLIFTTVLLWKHCYAQSVNIVPNPSFEDTLSCPTNQDQLYKALSWYNPTNSTPDYFNECYTGTGVFKPDVPSNFWGYQYAKTGNAYAGFGMCFLPFCINTREYISVPLNSTLENNKKYDIKFYVSLANLSSYATSNIGAYCSVTAPISSTIENLPFIPQVQNASNNIISDTANWALISGSFIANGGEQYLTIGNFNNDATTIKDTINNPGYGTYYYIDDVFVGLSGTTDTTISITIPNIFTPNNDGINDGFKITSKNITTLNCKIYNRWGILVGELKNVNDIWGGRTTAGLECAEGVYYYILMAIGVDGKEYDEKGFVSLVR